MQHHLRNLSMEEKIQGDIIAMRDLNWSYEVITFIVFCFFAFVFFEFTV